MSDTLTEIDSIDLKNEDALQVDSIRFRFRKQIMCKDKGIDYKSTILTNGLDAEMEECCRCSEGFRQNKVHRAE